MLGVGAAGVALFGLGARSFWIDEFFTMRFAQYEPWMLISDMASIDVHPPIYYLLVHYVTNLFGFSEFALRAPSALFFVMAVVLVFLLAKFVSDTRAAIYSAVIYMSSIFHIQHAQNARFYELLSLLTVASFFAFFLLNEKATKRRLVVYVATMAVGLYVHIGMFFVLAIQNMMYVLGLTISGKRARVVPWVMTQVAILALYVPWLPTLIEQMNGASTNPSFNHAPPGLLELAGTLFVFSSYSYTLTIVFGLLVLISLTCTKLGRGEVESDDFLRLGNLRLSISLVKERKRWVLAVWAIGLVGIPFVLSHVHTNVFQYRVAIAASVPMYILIGMCLSQIKVALFPLHVWLPNAYTYAPSAVSAFLAATATKVGIYMMFRFSFTVFAEDEYDFLKAYNSLVLVLCASLAIAIGALNAIRQKNLKRMLAYSSVSQIGYIVLGFSIANLAGVQASIVHILNHALTKGGLFMALGAVAYRLGSADIDTVRGLGRRMPFTMAAFTAGGLGLIGVPGTAGFISKWYLIRGALEAGLWPLALIVLIGSLLAIIYVWRVVEAIYFGKPEGEQADATEAPWSLLVPTWILIGASIYLGIHAPTTTGLAENAAHMLLN